ncbi:divalent-cation tolerance protein CutA [Vibrio nigripulchritudo]|uniref:divalent-cation tolerance protein CutA n=1 Tax=Vibrio nigripulchritudo TaxID=28173 RepID=UPI0005F9E6C6|nr:divalent-cation tolerance protein CutA [Vibrio nigripulchritudo]KJY76319.1 cytochrome C biogenesis protein [Vibrio nigripulchritudo]
MSESEFCVVLTTVNDNETKRGIVSTLLTEKLAACIQVLPIESYYLWEEKVCEDGEQLLVIKTQSARYHHVEEVIKKLHNYEVPQVVQLPISSGLSEYLDWIKSNTQA